jgi:DeoR/GlpR family transcriptional regulator of sugar metabolism
VSSGAARNAVSAGSRLKRLNNDEPTDAFEERLRRHAEAKVAIARLAASLVGDGESVALDGSTTAYYVARELRRKRELVVVTCSLRIAAALADAPWLALVLTGGLVQPVTLSVASVGAGPSLAGMRIDTGFFGARGLDLDRGLLGLHPAEARATLELVDACERVVGVVDGSKWRAASLVPLVDRARLDALVTDESADAGLVSAWRHLGVEVLVADSRTTLVETFHPRP